MQCRLNVWSMSIHKNGLVPSSIIMWFQVEFEVKNLINCCCKNCVIKCLFQTTIIESVQLKLENWRANLLKQLQVKIIAGNSKKVILTKELPGGVWILVSWTRSYFEINHTPYHKNHTTKVCRIYIYLVASCTDIEDFWLLIWW